MPERETAAKRAYAHVKTRVLDGRLPEGTLLSEVEVAAELAVSRTPVREAFVQLETEGVLRLYPRRGALVVPIGPRDVAEMLEARWVLERHAVETLMRDPAARAAASDTMAAEIDAQRAALAAADEAAFAAHDRLFHRAVVAAAGNGILLGLYDTLRERQQRMARRSMAQRATAILDEHAEIAAALRAGDDTTVLRVLRAHLDAVADPRTAG